MGGVISFIDNGTFCRNSPILIQTLHSQEVKTLGLIINQSVVNLTTLRNNLV